MSTFARAVKQDENLEPYDYSILIIGSSGSGKSTLINTIVNISLQSKITELQVAIKCENYPIISPEFDDGVCERNDEHKGESQTTYAHFYKISGEITNYKTVLIVDTPGITSTGGIRDDDKNVNEIINAAKRVKQFNAIFFTEKYSDNRMTPAFNYNVRRISNTIPSDFETSVFLIVNFACDKNKELNSDWYQFPIQQRFFLNNSVFRCPIEQYQAKQEKAMKYQNKLKKSEKSLRAIFQNAFLMDAKQTTQYHELFAIHNNIMKEIAELINHLENINSIRSGIENQEYIVITKKSVETAYHNTICTTHLVVCHQNCHLSFKGVYGTQYFDNCACMNSEKLCRVCGCGSLQHAHAHKKFVEEESTIEEILKEFSIDKNVFTSKEDVDKIISVKQGEILKRLHEAEKKILKINPRYILSKYFNEALIYIETELESSNSQINEAELKSNYDVFKYLSSIFGNWK
ncbi:hypothetical protein SteCoe_33264 [Stentor coeruleus]|uniref:G domain-containing protein n=1 Tax=Stentor coeruleus TaxID=5963 RepID=A0A1R2AX61_9CILI|nr:hypothetical protein SteCoe_33264 [Stentor coeruleus]